MDEYCGSKFWDWDLTWYTDDPELTSCFEKTVLAWVPVVFIFIFNFVDISLSVRSGKTREPIGWNLFNSAKILICIILGLIEIFRMSNAIRLDLAHYNMPAVEIYSPLLKFFAYAVALVLIVLAKYNGVSSSGVQFTYWLLLTLCEISAFRRIFRGRSHIDDEHDSLALLILEAIYYPLVVGQLLLHCWADTPSVSMYRPGRKKERSPEEESSTLSQLLISWYDVLTWRGFRKPLEVADLWELNPEFTSNQVVQEFDRAWVSKTKKISGGINSNKIGTNGKVEIGVLSILVKAFGLYYFLGGLLIVIPDFLDLLAPQILSLLISFMSGTEEAWKGYFYAVLLLVASAVTIVTRAQYNLRMYKATVKVKTALMSAVYRKALVISNGAKRESTVGEIVNLMSVDVQKVLEVMPYLNMAWCAPLEIALAMYFLWGLLGPSVLAGLAVMLLLIPINGFLGHFQRTCQMAQMARKDERVKLMTEVLSGIKVLKFFAWEESFETKIKDIRNDEYKFLTRVACFNAINEFLWFGSQFLVAVAAFATYVLVDDRNVLDAQTAFVGLSLFNAMTVPLTALPMVIIWGIQAVVSLGRLNKFMNAEEIDSQAVTHEKSAPDPIILRNCSFSWSRDSPAVLQNLDVRIKEGSLVAVVGAVGSGKSSLISAMLGEMEKIGGKINTKGSISYVAQQAWIQNATLRENILFGKPHDSSKYRKTVEACALNPDFEMLPAGDKTEIGERGINLSGGQKQRVSLARAVYNNSDLYLLDDPLSAVDAHVGKHIFEKVIGPAGILKRKTRVLVTHGTSFLPEVDQIIVMKNGHVSEVGSFKQLLDKKGEFSDFLNQYANQDDRQGEEEDVTAMMDLSNSHLERSEDLTIRRRKRLQSSLSNAGEDKEKLIEEEKSEVTRIPWSLYFDYIRAGSLRLMLPSFLMYIIYQASAVGANTWLSVWSAEPVVNGTQGNRGYYLGIYASFGILQSLSFLAAAIMISLGTLKASSRFHLRMLVRILQAPMSFFDTTPAGRIINRFARDVDVLDSTLATLLRNWISMFVSVVGAVVVIIYTVPLVAVICIPAGLLFYMVQKVYIPTSQQLKRLESVTRSPIYSHFQETIGGVATIRAYGQQRRFLSESLDKIDENQTCYYPTVISNRWLAIRLESVAAIIKFAAALFAVMSRETLTPGLVGLTLTYAIELTHVLSYLVRFICDIETNIVAVERIKEYCAVPQEAPWHTLRKPAGSWPELGRIKMINYQTRYREALPLVLKGLNCSIEPGEKVGVVGRTGAGKSSLALTLFRILEPAGGSICIDGEDISKLGLHDLRTKLTIIPQDPVLFSGTLRFNLDPFGKHSDNSIWKALELAHLKAFVVDLPMQLGHDIAEGGDNLSVGQKQLVCLARALLHKSKILILDEATAAVDLVTDGLIQETIRSEFKDCTVITIAHRLNTVMDSDRVMVVDNGTIREFDSPKHLLSNLDSEFSKLAKDAQI